MFLENTIKKNETTAKIAPWSQFKMMIWQVLDHRIQNSQEIYGSVNTAYVTMIEHLLLFMVETTKSRPEAELKLLEYLASLKYYADKWPRAKFYAQMCGLFLDSQFTPERPPLLGKDSLPPTA